MQEGMMFMVTSCLMILLVGAIVYYFNTRVSNLEKAIVKQNQVLSDFIVNVKGNVMNQVDIAPPSGASPEAIANAQSMYRYSNPTNKIVVSEEDNLLQNDSDVSDSETDDDTDSDDESNEDSVTDPVEVEQMEPVEVEQMEPVEVEQMEPVEVEQMEPVEVEQMEPVEVEQMEPVEVEQMEPVNVHVELEDKEIEYNKLKVSQLRELAKEKGLTNHNLKKSELIKALLKV